MWELPLARGLQYYHCALRAQGLWTIPPKGDPMEELLGIESEMEAMDLRHIEDDIGF